MGRRQDFQVAAGDVLRTGKVLALGATLLVFGNLSAGAQTPTVDAIKARDHLLCSGVTSNLEGFAVPDDKGEWYGIDVDMCKAIASTVLGDSKKIKMVPLSYVQRFPALQAGNVDVIAKNTTWTMTRNTELGIMFSTPYLFTGLGFMTNKKLGVKTGVELKGATVCMAAGTTLEQGVADFFAEKKVAYKPLGFENVAERDKAYLGGRCDAVASFIPGLAALRLRASAPADEIILPDVLGKEIISVGVRQGDEKFFNIVNWTIFALLEAEELGITSENIDQMKNDPRPAVRRFLGITPGIGKKLGLRETWAYDVIKQNGNYKQIYDRNLGDNSKLKMDRALSKLWRDGGSLYSPSFE